MNGVVVLSERNTQAWAVRRLGQADALRVCSTLGDMLRVLALARPGVVVIELPVTGASEAELAEMLLGNRVLEGLRLVLVGVHPERAALAERQYPGLRAVPESASDAVLQDAIGRAGAMLGMGESPLTSWDPHETRAVVALLTGQAPAERAAALSAWVGVLQNTPVLWDKGLATVWYLAPAVRLLARELAQIPQGDGTGGPSALAGWTLAWVRLLGTVLRAVDRGVHDGLERHLSRCWAVQQKMRALEYLIETHTGWGVALPLNTWTRLHDLHQYVHGRVLGEQPTSGDNRTCTMLWDVRNSYVRSLLWGCCAVRVPPALVRDSRVRRQVGRWARRTALREPGAQDWGRGMWVVDGTRDSGPRIEHARSGKGYALVPPGDCLALLDGAPAGALEIAAPAPLLARRVRGA